MQRIAIIGCCGAGKSTLANVLGSKLSLPVIHLDSYYWQPQWVETATEKWIITHQSLIKSDRWIIDGNYIGTMDSRLAAADTIIWLDVSRLLCLWRIWQRYLKYRGIVRPDLADGCVERLNWDFLLYVWNFNRNQRQLILSKIKIYKHCKQLIICQNQQQLNSFLSEIK
jgi:adenylate kinase family enzyme